MFVRPQNANISGTVTCDQALQSSKHLCLLDVISLQWKEKRDNAQAYGELLPAADTLVYARRKAVAVLCNKVRYRQRRA